MSGHVFFYKNLDEESVFTFIMINHTLTDSRHAYLKLKPGAAWTALEKEMGALGYRATSLQILRHKQESSWGQEAESGEKIDVSTRH